MPRGGKLEGYEWWSMVAVCANNGRPTDELEVGQRRDWDKIRYSCEKAGKASFACMFVQTLAPWKEALPTLSDLWPAINMRQLQRRAWCLSVPHS